MGVEGVRCGKRELGLTLGPATSMNHRQASRTSAKSITRTRSRLNACPLSRLLSFFFFFSPSRSRTDSFGRVHCCPLIDCDPDEDEGLWWERLGTFCVTGIFDHTMIRARAFCGDSYGILSFLILAWTERNDYSTRVYVWQEILANFVFTPWLKWIIQDRDSFRSNYLIFQFFISLSFLIFM